MPINPVDFVISLISTPVKPTDPLFHTQAYILWEFQERHLMNRNSLKNKLDHNQKTGFRKVIFGPRGEFLGEFLKEWPKGMILFPSVRKRDA